MPKVITDIESSLIRDSIKGDAAAQRKLYYRYAKGMLNVAYRIVGNKEDAKDVLQDAFIKAFGNLAGLKNHQGFAAWLKRIIVNTSINHIKRKGLLLVDFKDEIAVNIPETEITYNEIEIEHVKSALMELPEGYRAVLTLYLIEGYDHQEISEILGISKSTSLTQYSRGKKKLINILQKNK